MAQTYDFSTDWRLDARLAVEEKRASGEQDVQNQSKKNASTNTKEWQKSHGSLSTKMAQEFTREFSESKAHEPQVSKSTETVWEDVSSDEFLHLMQSTRNGLIVGLQIEMALEEGQIVCRMPIEADHLGAPQVAHGGAIMALLDTALGAHAGWHAIQRGRATSTVELKTNFLRPAREGTTLVTSTTIQSVGKSLLVVSGTAMDSESGEAIAFAVGTFNIYKHPGITKFLQLRKLES